LVLSEPLVQIQEETAGLEGQLPSVLMPRVLEGLVAQELGRLVRPYRSHMAGPVGLVLSVTRIQKAVTGTTASVGSRTTALVGTVVVRSSVLAAEVVEPQRLV
jgi:hypothetical protein